MSLPEEVILRTVTFGPYTNSTGQYQTGTVTFIAIRRNLIWVADGSAILRDVETRTIVDGSGEIDLPASDQAGFGDGEGNFVTNWAYRATWRIDGQPTTFKDFILPQGVGPVDLDLVTPVVGQDPSIITQYPQVLSVDGKVGHVITTGGGSGGPHGTEHFQSAAASTWIIAHSLGRRPSVSIYIDGEEVDADIVANTSQVSVIFPSPRSGYAVLV